MCSYTSPSTHSPKASGVSVCGDGAPLSPSSHASWTGPTSQYSHLTSNELTMHHGPVEPSVGSGLRQWLWPPRLASGYVDGTYVCSFGHSDDQYWQSLPLTVVFAIPR